MDRRDFLAKSGLGLAGISFCVAGLPAISCSSEGKDENNPVAPNFLIIFCDDAGWKDFGYHGSEIKTPNIDRMASGGVELDYFYAFPVCTPTRAALLTGKPASRSGVIRAIGAHDDSPLPRDTVTLAELLRREGYDTALSGKWHLGNELDVTPISFGFNHGHGFLGPWVDMYTHRSQKNKVSWHRNGEFVEEEGHATDLIANETIRFIREKRDKSKPFFMYTAFNAPHLPLQEEDRWIAPYNDTIESESRRYYAASITHMDDAIGRILSALREEKLDKNTLVIFFSDNGAEKGGRKGYLNPIPTYKTTPAIDRYGDNGPLRGWKGQLYEGGIRVPALMYWPDKLKPGKNSDTMIVYDILPTLIHLAGGSPPEELNIEGKNLWPAVTGTFTLKERILYWRSARNFALRKGQWKLIHNGKTPDEGTDELFNISEDPYETRDMAEGKPTLLKELKKELSRQFALDPQKHN